MLAARLGSVRVSPGGIAAVVANKLFSAELPGDVTPSIVSIIWDIRLPRALSAFIVGAMLSVSGAVVQALLQNPLASSYTLGVSSGASLGAALVIVNEISIPVIGTLMLPVTGFIFGLGTVLLVIFFSQSHHHSFRNDSISFCKRHADPAFFGVFAAYEQADIMADGNFCRKKMGTCGTSLRCMCRRLHSGLLL